MTCRLINPTKSNIGVISKNILDRVNGEMRSKLQINQWTSTKEVLKWFSNFDDKKSLKFLKFDVEQFYPSISKTLMLKAIQLARSYTNISIQEEEILFHDRLNILMDSDGNVWKKKTKPKFHVLLEYYYLLQKESSTIDHISTL